MSVQGTVVGGNMEKRSSVGSASRVALVTGGTGGLGSVIARQLAAAGCRVVVHYGHDASKADAVIADCVAAGSEAIAVAGDLADDEACRHIVAEAAAAWGRLDVLVNNAAITRFIPHPDLEAMTATAFRDILDVNLLGPFQLMRAAAPWLVASGLGSVVNVSSTAGQLGGGSSIAYAASKAALDNLTLSMARVLAPSVRVNAISPGFIASEWMRAGVGDERYAAMMASQQAAAPLQQVASCDDVAEVAVWLALSARHLTGELIRIDNGLHLGRGPGLPQGVSTSSGSTTPVR
ncbi:MAG: SDR-family protein [Rhizobacter sp.]|nr:SDR-family protein [Rhizobacter sp.]